MEQSQLLNTPSLKSRVRVSTNSMSVYLIILVETKMFKIPVYLIASLHECTYLRKLIRQELQVKRTITGEYHSSILCYHYW